MRRAALVSVTAVVFTISTSPVSAQAPIADRPSITVTSFDYGTVAAQISGDGRTRSRLGRMGVRDGAAFAEALGTGAADLVVEKLVESDRFRVFERNQLDAIRREQTFAGDNNAAMPPARYVVTGAVTRLGLNDHEVGGMGGGAATGMLLARWLGPFALLGVKESSTTVHLTARVVDTRTGEIIGSFTGEGASKKRWGVNVLGVGRGGFGGARAEDKNFRETAVGEATTQAAEAIAEQVVALRATRLTP